MIKGIMIIVGVPKKVNPKRFQRMVKEFLWFG